MAVFSQSYQTVKSNEGGYVNNPNDRGGETYKGIARKMWPGWPGWVYVEAFKTKTDFPQNLEKSTNLQDLVHSFYKENFWDVLKLDDINSQVIATELFDTSVNQGSGVAAIYLQRALNITNKNGSLYPDIAQDGKVGPTTVRVANAHPDKRVLLLTLNLMQGAKYISICEADKSQEGFYYGWMKRVMEQWELRDKP